MKTKHDTVEGVQKSQTTTWNEENPVNNWIFTISTGCRCYSINSIITSPFEHSCQTNAPTLGPTIWNNGINVSQLYIQSWLGNRVKPWWTVSEGSCVQHRIIAWASSCKKTHQDQLHVASCHQNKPMPRARTQSAKSLKNARLTPRWSKPWYMKQFDETKQNPKWACLVITVKLRHVVFMSKQNSRTYIVRH